MANKITISHYVDYSRLQSRSSARALCGHSKWGLRRSRDPGCKDYIKHEYYDLQCSYDVTCKRCDDLAPMIRLSAIDL